jgi:hypothetical protein
VTIHSLNPGTRLTGDARDIARQKAADLYSRGATIQSVARELGRSYGLARELLIEARVPLRARGGRIRKANAR